MNFPLFNSKSKTFDEILPSFLADNEIRLKHKSYLAYTGKTKVFSEWLALRGITQTPLRKIDNDIMAEFFRYLATERNLDRPTCEKYFLILRSAWRWAIQREYAEYEPFKLITYPKKGVDKGAQVIPPDHAKILLEDIKANDKQLYLAYMTQFFLCLRPGRELRLLKLSDMDFSQGTVTVTSDNAKTGSRRVVTMPQQYIELCVEYGLDKYDKNLYVFGSNKQGVPGTKPWSENMLRWKFNKYRDKHNFPKSYQFYSGKHGGITMLHNSGVPLMVSMQQAGHSTISSHQHYLHKHSGMINETIRAHYPNPY